MEKYKLYIDECKKHKILVMVTVLLLVIETWIVFRLPFAMEGLMHLLFNISKSNFSLFIIMFMKYMALSIIQILIILSSKMIFKVISNRITTSMVLNLYHRVYQSKTSWPAQFSIDEVLQTINGDAFSLGDNGIKIAFQIVHTCVNIAGLLYYMLKTNLLLAIFITVNFVLVMFLQKKINSILAKKLTIIRKSRGEFAYSSNSFLNNYISYRQIKGGNYFSEKVKKRIIKYLKDSFIIEKYSGINIMFGSFSSLINTIFILGIGAYMLINGYITLGVLVTFSTFANTFGSFITGIPNIYMQAKEFGISYERVQKINNINCHQEKSIDFITDEGVKSINLKNINFTYNNKMKVIDDFTLRFSRGNIYCIKGKNGAGKTTLINILLGEYPISLGEIEVNEHVIKLEEYVDAFSKHITYCPSATLLFNDTIKNNIGLGFTVNDNALSEIIEALNMVSDPSLEMENNVDVMHNNLSDGQKQKIALARSFLDNKEVMIFDEIEMHLDTDTKANIMKYLQNIKSGKIIIIISHDDFVVEQSDIVIQL